MNTAKAFDYAPGSITPSMLSRLNLSHEEVVKDAAHEFRRCSTDAAFAAWARKWGANAIAALLDGPDREDVEETEAYQEIDRGLTKLVQASEKAVAALAAIAERETTPDALSGELDQIVSDLACAADEAS